MRSEQAAAGTPKIRVDIHGGQNLDVTTLQRRQVAGQLHEISRDSPPDLGAEDLVVERNSQRSNPFSATARRTPPRAPLRRRRDWRGVSHGRRDTRDRHTLPRETPPTPQRCGGKKSFRQGPPPKPAPRRSA